MTREEIMNADEYTLTLEVAERLFQAKVITKETDPNAHLLIGWYGEKAWKPMRGSWHNAYWRDSEEKAWLDCPKFAEEISAAWEVAEHFKAKSYLYSLKNLVGGIYEFSLTDWGGKCNIYIGQGDTAPLAISRAALLTTMEETP